VLDAILIEIDGSGNWIGDSHVDPLYASLLVSYIGYFSDDIYNSTSYK
jgi:hypothetical protein